MINIRKSGFFFLDLLQGSKIRKHLDNIRECKKDENLIFQKKQLDKILQYACTEIPFYKGIDSSSIKNFPVMNKIIYNKNKDSVINPKYELGELYCTSTSGSSGVPFKTYQDKNKRKRNNADLITLFSDFGFDIGEKYVFIRSWVSLYNLTKLKMLKQNFVGIDVNTFDYNEKEKLRLLLHKDKKIKAIVSYGSALEDFVNYLEEKNDNCSDFNLKLISSSADALSNSVKERLEKKIGCPVINRYSNEECGILGYTKANTTIISLNTASYFFELLNLNNDNPVKAGEIGRIVVTDLYNKAMPLIRYDVGDLGISSEDGDCIINLTTLEGRMDDVIINSKGIVISSVTLSTYMQAFDYIERYQLIKDTDSSLKMLVVSKNNEFDDLLFNLKTIFGSETNIKIEKVDKIKKESTGKYKEIKIKK